MTLWSWSRTAASNATADATINYAEGQTPSSINDSARAAMAAVAKYRDDISGAILTGGTSTAYTIASYQVIDTLAHMDGAMIAFTPHVTNGATVTLNRDNLGTKPLRSAPSVELLAGTLIAGTPYVATYNNSDAVWYLQGFYGNPYNIPLGGGMVYVGTTVPNSSFAFPNGAAISRTTYATLFTLISTTYGVGDGSTTFNLPNWTGRVIAMKEASATRLTATYFGGNSTTLGATGGNESDVLLTANLPSYTPSGTITSGSFLKSGGVVITAGGGAGSTLDGVQPGTGSLSSLSLSFDPQGGTSTPIRTVQPTIIENYILRII